MSEIISYKCFNQSATVLSFKLDNLYFELLPKGMKDDVIRKYDCCTVPVELIKHPNIIPFIETGKLKVVPVKQFDTKNEVESLVSTTLVACDKKLNDFKSQLDVMLKEKKENLSETINSTFKEIEQVMAKITADLNISVAKINSLKSEIEALSIPKNDDTIMSAKSMGNKKGRVADNLFSK